MTNEQQQVRKWMKQFGQETPEKPTIPDLATRKLRAKITLEEALETCHALNMHPYVKKNLYEDDMIELDDIGFWEDPKQQIFLKDIADGDADQRVVGAGTLVACGLIHKTSSVYRDHLGNVCDSRPIEYGTDPLFNEVMRSNFSKLWCNAEISQHFKIRVLDNLQVACEEGGYFAKRINENKWLVKDKDGKVIKSPSYSPANLQPIIDQMSL